VHADQAAPWSLDEELTLARFAIALGATGTGGALSSAEERLAASAEALAEPSKQARGEAIAAIRAGCDPLGERLIAARKPSARRLLGQVFTPNNIVAPMVEWVLAQSPSRIVDAGCGSGRFTVAVARQSAAYIVAFDTDPLSTLVTRAGLASIGNTTATVLNSDYTQAILPPHDGKTAFVGNPPYVRHHSLSAGTKAWAQMAARRAGVPISGLAGLHAYFFLATALHGDAGDVGCFVTSSEWLDVNYGEVIRRLLLDGLGGRAIHVLEPTALPFDSTATTAAITCFEIGSRPTSIRIRMVDDATKLPPLTAGRLIGRKRLADAHRWLPLIRSKPVVPEGYVELGEVCRVHRGAVTGSNATWIVPATGGCTIPDRYLFPTVTRARELISCGDRLDATQELRRVIDLPIDLDELDSSELPSVERFLKAAKASGAADGYVAQNRKAWWSVGLREPAPILATYMARRAPAFARNVADARHINIAHGLYPLAPLPDYALDRLAAALRGSASIGLGRTYAGGLVKFEPREMERIPVPSLERLLSP
jgi:SAM-dependent methyltransferase